MGLPATSTHAWGLLAVIVGVAIFSVDTLLIRLQTMSPAAILFWRGLFTALGFALLTYRANRAGFLRSFRGLGLAGLLVAGLRGLANISFVLSVKETSVAHTLVIVASAPVLTALLSRFLLSERLPLRTWLAAATVMAGVAAIFSSNLGSAQLVGDLWALVGALTISITLVIIRGNQNLDRFAAMTIGCGLGVIPTLASAGQGFALSPHNGLIALVNGLIVLPLAMALITWGPKRLTASEVSLIIPLEAALGPVWVWLAIGETPNLQTVLSGAVIIGALGIHSALELKQERAHARHAAVGPVAIMPDVSSTGRSD